jgi:hypothetical protein
LQRLTDGRFADLGWKVRGVSWVRRRRRRRRRRGRRGRKLTANKMGEMMGHRERVMGAGSE